VTLQWIRIVQLVDCRSTVIIFLRWHVAVLTKWTTHSMTPTCHWVNFKGFGIGLGSWQDQDLRHKKMLRDCHEARHCFETLEFKHVILALL